MSRNGLWILKFKIFLSEICLYNSYKFQCQISFRIFSKTLSSWCGPLEFSSCESLSNFLIKNSSLGNFGVIRHFLWNLLRILRLTWGFRFKICDREQIFEGLHEFRYETGPRNFEIKWVSDFCWEMSFENFGGKRPTNILVRHNLKRVVEFLLWNRLSKCWCLTGYWTFSMPQSSFIFKFLEILGR